MRVDVWALVLMAIIGAIATFIALLVVLFPLAVLIWLFVLLAG